MNEINEDWEPYCDLGEFRRLDQWSQYLGLLKWAFLKYTYLISDNSSLSVHG